MIFNGSTEYLARWCREREEAYREQLADSAQSLLFVKRRFFDAMAYKLYMLTDRKVDSFESWRRLARELVAYQRSCLLRADRDPKAKEVLRTRDQNAMRMQQEVEEEFLSFLAGMTQADSIDPQRYLRILTGEEKAELEYAVLEKWNYDTRYWYPISGGFDESRLFLSADRFEPYHYRLCAMVGLPQVRIYECGESLFEPSACAEVDDICGYGGYECAYFPKDLSWIIYFSHENTVTFAGTIVPMVKELMEKEREHWNRWD